MSVNVTVPRAQIEEYKQMIKTLQHENRQLIESKLELIASTAKEIDRLRRYIHSLTSNKTATTYTEGIDLTIDEIEPTAVTPRGGIETIQLCDHCGSKSNVNNNYFISISSVQQQHQIQDDPGYIDQSQLQHSEDEEKKEEILYEDSSDDNDDDDDDDHAVVHYLSDNEHSSMSQQDTFITPGRPSIISMSLTRGNSLPMESSQECMGGEHADIPLPDNFMDDSFVICDHCTSTLPLQFVRKYPDTMECSKCFSFFEYIFLCNECGKCVCGDCYEYEAKMQSIDRISSYFVPNEQDFNGEKLRFVQQQICNESALCLNEIINICLSESEFSSKLCYEICLFLDIERDLVKMCDILCAAQLFDVYWNLSPPKTSLKKKFGFSYLHLSHSLKWANCDKMWCIKEVIDGDIMIQNYLLKNYQTINFEMFYQRLSKFMETNTDYVKLLESLKFVVERDGVQNCELLEYNQFAWRELGGPPSACSKGMYLIWNIASLQRSYCFNVDNRILDQPFKGH